ncbi:NTP transferase domain-containing protein [Patescibacteria group bacterium]|nr:NTP transferase domain-containing protein [Patescibacteria group bacterium]
MIGLIYCAGYGKRLGKLTESMPKCMMDVNGKPCLERIIEHFNYYGVNKIIVNTHWCNMRIMEYFGDRLLYTFEPVLLGESQTLQRLRPWLKDNYVIVANGDTLSDVNIDNLKSISMSGGVNVRHVDKGIYAGYSVLHKDYFNGNMEFTNLITPAEWVDIGDPNRLKLANELYKTSDEDKRREIYKRVQATYRMVRRESSLEQRKKDDSNNR